MRYYKIIFSPICFILCLSFVILLIISMDGVRIPRNLSPVERYEMISLLNLSHFKYKINNDVCNAEINSAYIKAILIITSHAGNTHIRQAHRTAMPKNTLLSIGVRRVFLLAISQDLHNEPYKTIQQKEIEKENNLNGDLIQGNFNEAYRNLTYKHVMGLQWVSKFCDRAQYVIKMDDDIIVNIYQLLKLIPKEANVSKSFLLGYVLKGVKPSRNPSNKWFVTQREYPKSFYPPFLSGWMYVTTPVVAGRIVNYTSNRKYNFISKMSAYQSFFWIDDVFVTGIIARQLRVQLIDFSKYFAVHPQYFQCCVEAALIQRSKSKIHDTRPCEFVVGPSGGDMQLLFQVLKDAENCWRAAEHCQSNFNHSDVAKKCIVGRVEAYDWIRRPHGKGKALMEEINL